jgi:DNA (cytosine-5)-methyltransferase 1
MRNLGLLDGEETEDEDEGREGEEGKENEEMEKDDASRSIFSGARTETHNEHDRQQHEQNVWDIIIDHSNGSGDEEDQQDETISYSLYGNKWDEIDKRVPEQEASKDYDSDSENEEYDSEDDQINVLTESTYNARKASPEITVNGRNFRVGDCYDMQDGLKLKIKNLYARQEEAECIQYIPSRDTFVYDTFEFASSSSSSRQIYLRLSTSVTIPVSDLKTRCDAKSFRQSGWIYEHGILSNGGRFRSGALYNNKGRVAASSPGKPKVLELFAGAGGMCLGWRNAGFISKWVVEKDSIFINNLGANFDSAETVLYDCCVRDFLKGCQSNDPNEASAYPKQGEVDHIHASPPCKGYSRANRYGGVNDAENNNLSFEFINAVRHFRPKTATFENVLGMLLNTRKHKNINNLKKILSDLEKMNYQLRWCILDSSDYGDPQERKRITVWAAREDMILPSIPLPTHGVGEGMLRKRTVKDAISSLEVFKPSVGREHRAPIHINGVKVDNHSVPSRIPGPEDFDSGLLEADLPSRTVKCNIHLVHYNEERFISVREAACLQSFPWDYQLIAGDRAKQYEMIGNAMPVMMGTQIARSVGKVYGLP